MSRPEQKAEMLEPTQVEEILKAGGIPVILTSTPLIPFGERRTVGGVSLVETRLEFIDFGDSSYISWGYMLHNGDHFLRDAWWMIFFPAAAISLLVLALHAVGDALNRALATKSRIEHLDKPA